MISLRQAEWMAFMVLVPGPLHRQDQLLSTPSATLVVAAAGQCVLAARFVEVARLPPEMDGTYHFTIVHSKSLTSSLTKLKPFKIHICKCQG